jgi:hypothetical protein
MCAWGAGVCLEPSSTQPMLLLVRLVSAKQCTCGLQFSTGVISDQGPHEILQHAGSRNLSIWASSGDSANLCSTSTTAQAQSNKPLLGMIYTHRQDCHCTVAAVFIRTMYEYASLITCFHGGAICWALGPAVMYEPLHVVWQERVDWRPEPDAHRLHGHTQAGKE